MFINNFSVTAACDERWRVPSVPERVRHFRTTRIEEWGHRILLPSTEHSAGTAIPTRVGANDTRQDHFGENPQNQRRTIRKWWDRTMNERIWPYNTPCHGIHCLCDPDDRSKIRCSKTRAFGANETTPAGFGSVREYCEQLWNRHELLHRELWAETTYVRFGRKTCCAKGWNSTTESKRANGSWTWRERINMKLYRYQNCFFFYWGLTSGTPSRETSHKKTYSKELILKTLTTTQRRYL